MQTKLSWAADAHEVVIEGVASTAVYTDDLDQIIILQKGKKSGQDNFIVMPPTYVQRLIDALQLELDKFNPDDNGNLTG